MLPVGLLCEMVYFMEDSIKMTDQRKDEMPELTDIEKRWMDVIQKRDYYIALSYQNTSGLSLEDRARQAAEYDRARQDYLDAERKCR